MGEAGLREARGAGGGGGGAVTRRPPAAPGRARASVSGSQRSLLSVASDSATARRPRDLAPRYPHPADGGFSLFAAEQLSTANEATSGVSSGGDTPGNGNKPAGAAEMSTEL